MMGPQNPQQQDDSMAMLWIVFGLMILGGLIWYMFKVQIVQGLFVLRRWELIPIQYLLDLKFLPASWSTNVQNIQSYLNNTAPSDVTLDDIISISKAVCSFYRFPVAAISVVCGIIVYLSCATLNYKKKLSMESLLQQEQVNWPQVAPILKLNLVEQDINVGPWAMALTPMAFCRKHDLLAEETAGPEYAAFNPRVKKTATLLNEKALNVFTMQLGRHWMGIDAMPMPTQALFAIFAAKITGDREGSTKLVDSINRSIALGKIDFAGVRPLLVKHHGHKLVQRIMASHAYETTIMAGMLYAARNDGVLASADFLWIKPIDRGLWLLLNSVGRQTAFTEVSGAFAHWLAERELGRALFVPMVEEAVVGMEAALAEVIYVPLEKD